MFYLKNNQEKFINDKDSIIKEVEGSSNYKIVRDFAKLLNVVENKEAWIVSDDCISKLSFNNFSVTYTQKAGITIMEGKTIYKADEVNLFCFGNMIISNYEAINNMVAIKIRLKKDMPKISSEQIGVLTSV